MSGSYQQLLQKYNQLLALIVNNPGGFQNLSSVLGFGNTTTNSAIFQVDASVTTIESTAIEVKNVAFTSEIYPDSIFTRTSDGSIGISLQAYGTPLIAVVDGGSCQIFPNELRFEIGTIPPVPTAGISVVGTGLNIKTNGTLTFEDLVGSPGQVLTYDGLGNAVWDDIPTSGAISGTFTVPAGSSTGTIPFGVILGAVPTVVISQVKDVSGPIARLALVSTTTSDFTWESNTSNVGKINWIAI
jgi:hypothetical protein